MKKEAEAAVQAASEAAAAETREAAAAAVALAMRPTMEGGGGGGGGAADCMFELLEWAHPPIVRFARHACTSRPLAPPTSHLLPCMHESSPLRRAE